MFGGNYFIRASWVVCGRPFWCWLIIGFYEMIL